MTVPSGGFRAASCKKSTRKNKLIRKNKSTRTEIFRYKISVLVDLFFLINLFFSYWLLHEAAPSSIEINFSTSGECIFSFYAKKLKVWFFLLCITILERICTMWRLLLQNIFLLFAGSKQNNRQNAILSISITYLICTYL